MKWIFLLAIPLSLALTSAQTPVQSGDTIEWSPERKLTWNDFQARPVPNTTTVASTNTALGVDFHIRNNKLQFDIDCHFDKKKSWVLKKSAYVLQHEQGHFDIAEIYARILYKRLSEYKFNASYEADLNRIYKTTVEEKMAFQQRYDRETDHNRNNDKQEAWLETIAAKLNEYEAWKGYH